MRGLRLLLSSTALAAAAAVFPPAASAAAEGPEGPPLVLFSAGTPSYGYDLWISDGTRRGTRRLLDLTTGHSFAFTYGLTPVGDGRAYFLAYQDGGVALWVTDGTVAGTRRIRELQPPPAAAAPEAGDPSDPRASCMGDRFLGTAFFAGLGGGRHVFAGPTATQGEELWITDGTEAGTRLLRDIRPGAGSSFPDLLVPLGDGRVLFFAETDETGREPWVTDGTTAGTQLVLDINPGPDDGSRDSGAAVLADGRVLFTGVNGAAGAEPWVSDGTAEGTLLLRDIRPGKPGSQPSGFFPLGDGRVLFAANDGVFGREVWITDGTPGSAGGTVLLDDLRPGSPGSDPLAFGPLGDDRALFVVVMNPAHGLSVAELWVTDGSAAGTRRLAELARRAAIGLLRARISAFGERALLAGQVGRRSPPWITDGTPDGTGRLAPGRAIDVVDGFCDLGDGRALFGAGGGIWITDGTDAGTRPIRRELGVVGMFTLLRAGTAP